MKTKSSFANEFAFAPIIRRALYTVCFLFAGIFAYSQSETNNFTTYDTVFVNGNYSWNLRISRPVNMFTANHPDTASRPALINMQGLGEVGTNTSLLTRHGIHYWLKNGWDGGIQLGNGKHYPILITVMPRQNNGSNYTWPHAPQTHALMTHILNTYRIKRNSVHVSGLSMGAYTWNTYIVYEASAGAETGMKNITSMVALQFASNETFAPYNAWSRGWNAFGVWADKYGGTYFGLEGTNDGRNMWQVQTNMNSAEPGSAYFAYENINGGGHCCWNDMYNPSRKNWKSTGSPLGTNIATNGAHPNSMGTYVNGWSVFEWQLRQGDTTLVGGSGGGSSNISPTVDAGPSQTMTLPANSTQLNGIASDPDGTIASYSWLKTSGPTSITFSSTTIQNPTISNLTAGVYSLRLTVTDNNGATAFDNVTITVNGTQPPPPPPGGGKSVKVNLYGGSNPYNNTQWNNWNVGTSTSSNLVSPVFNYSDGTTSTVKASLNESTGMGDNTSSYPAGMAPSEVLRYSSYSTIIRTLTISGLSPSTQYSLELYAARNSNTNNRTVFTVGTKKDTVTTYNNVNEKAVLTNLVPNAQGEIQVKITRLNMYTYLNGFTLTVDSSGSAGRSAEINEEENATTTELAQSTIDIFPNPVREGFALKINNDQSGQMNVSITNMSGVTVKTFTMNKDRKSSQVYLPTSGLTPGIYIVKVQIGSWTETKQISKL